MLEGRPRYRDFQREQATRKSELVRSVAFAQRWALIGNRGEEVYLFDGRLKEASRILGDEEIRQLGQANIGAIGAAAVRKILQNEDLSGVEVEVQSEVHDVFYGTTVVVSVSPER